MAVAAIEFAVVARAHDNGDSINDNGLGNQGEREGRPKGTGVGSR